MANDNTIELTPKEIEFILKFRKLSPEMQKLVCSKIIKLTKPNQNTAPIR